MNVKNTFLKLTSWTVPHKMESSMLKYLPKNIKQDRFGNYYLQIGKTRTIFTSHLDTVCSGTQTRVKHVIDGYMIKTDGKTTLGADDKAGVTVMLYMIEKKIPGLYYFFVGEEVGCVGSSKAAKDTQRFNKQKWDRMVSFDRRDTCSVITYQSGQRCCSEDFAVELAKRLSINGLNLRPDNTGVYTDSAKFMPIIPECTNISVGYYSEHSQSERQNINYLEQLCVNVCSINWETLPTRRDPSRTEYRSYGGYAGGGWSDYEDWYNNDDYCQGNYSHSQSRHSQLQREKERENRSISLRDKEFWNQNDDMEEGRTKVYGNNNHKKDPFTEKDYVVNFPADEEDEFDIGNVFLDDFTNPLILNDKTKYFDTIKDKYLDDLITDEEIELLADQILDLNDQRDLNFYKELQEIRNQKNFIS